MRSILFGLGVAVLGLAVSSGRGDEKEDQKAMAGTWLPVEGELGGQKFPDDVLKTIKLTLGDGKYTVQAGDKLDKGTYKLDTAANPKAIDITGTEGPNQGKTILAIYDLKGDTLRVCYDLEGKKRPTEFKTAMKSQQFLVRYKRDKN